MRYSSFSFSYELDDAALINSFHQTEMTQSILTVRFPKTQPASLSVLTASVWLKNLPLKSVSVADFDFQSKGASVSVSTPEYASRTNKS